MAEMNKTVSSTVIGKLKGIFARHGIPSVVISDNGPPFNSSEFASFGQNYGFQHVTSSPIYPASNGEAERAVQTAKHILTASDPYLALLAYRNTTHSTTGYSPAQLSMGRPMRTTIPTIKFNLQPKVPNREVVLLHDQKAKQNYKMNYDRRYGTRQLPELFPGDNVNIRANGDKTTTPGIIAGTANTPQSYIINTDKGSLRRNRQHLQVTPRKEASPDSTTSQTSPVETSNNIADCPKNDCPKSRFGREIKPRVKLNL